MYVFIDSREKERAIKKIVKHFDDHGIIHKSSKLYVGDYQSLDNPRVFVDRKQNLTEMCANVCQGHDRFRRELIRAQEMDARLIILIEHGMDVNSIEDVAKWVNPRIREGNKAMTGATLSKIMQTLSRKCGCEFEFCDKDSTGRRIIELLEGLK